MIQGMRASINQVQAMLNELNNSRFVFHLTGSRCFSPTIDPVAQGERDYDLYAQDSSEVRQYLEQLGFCEVEDDFGYLGNPNQVKLYRIFPEMNQHIDVQLVLDVVAKNIVQTQLKNLSGMRGRYDKLERRELWHFAFGLYDDIKRSVQTKLQPRKGLQTQIGNVVLYLQPNTIMTEAIKNNHKLGMIKLWRSWTEMGLKESKDIIDANWDSWKAQLQSLYPKGTVFMFNSYVRTTGGLEHIPYDEPIEVFGLTGYIKITAQRVIMENNKLAIIKWVRNAGNLGLKDAKDLVECNWVEWREQLGC